MESGKALCELCGKTFSFKKNLYKHMREYHGMAVNIKFCELMESQKALCDLCGETFKFRKNLYKHMRNRHNMDVNLNLNKEKCNTCGMLFSSVAALGRHNRKHNMAHMKVSCTECNDFTCRSMRDLRIHLECQHGINIKREEMEFDATEQFLEWKVNMESETSVSFIKKGGGNLDPEKFKIYYFCHRSGNCIKSGTGLRLRGPSVKIGRTCPASLIATKMPTGKVSVQFYSTHAGHSLSTGSLHLSSADRAMVADLIASGLTNAEILKKIREGVHDSCFRRVHMLKMKDIYNIKKQYKLGSPSDKNEAVSEEQPASVITTENLQAAVQDRCEVLKEMLGRVADENLSYYIESLDRLIQAAGVAVASQEENSSGRQEVAGPLHDHTYI